MPLRDFLKDRTIQIALAAGIFGGAATYWFQPYNDRYLLGVDIYLLMAILALLFSLGVGLARRERWFQIAAFLCAGFVISFMGRIFYDITFIDKTHHNLWPFEILYALAIIVPSAAAGSLIAYLITKPR